MPSWSGRCVDSARNSSGSFCFGFSPWSFSSLGGLVTKKVMTDEERELAELEAAMAG